MITSHTRNNIEIDNKAVRITGLGKKYPFAKSTHRDIKNILGNFWALKEVSLTVYKGKVLGIIGRNGAGKTTLLNIIAGTLSATEGECLVQGKAMGLFNLGIGFQDELTGLENIYLNGTILGAGRGELNTKISSIIDFSELGDFVNMPLGSYSQGMRLRLGFSIIANLDFDILILDEILAVGDVPFQSKCFERLMDLKRDGKTLIITSQGMDLIERLCDEVILLDHGRLIFCGDVLEGVNRYRMLLNTERFFVGKKQEDGELVENTKKWADDISEWGQKLGSKEVFIESVELINRFGFRCNQIRSKEPLKIKVGFIVKNNVKDPHFGVAIFRNDGVYCYGPNTEFDRCTIAELKPGKGYFILDYHNLLLAPGEYYLSVAIWDKKETLAFDYQCGCHKLLIKGGGNREEGFLKIPYKADKNFFAKISKFLCWRKLPAPDVSLLGNKWGQKKSFDGITVKSMSFFNSYGHKRDIFFTNDYVKCTINFNKGIEKEKTCIWVGIYRDDGIYCQGATIPANNGKSFNLTFPELALLPGRYNVSAGIWDDAGKRFLMYHHGMHPFRMVFDRGDHGTVYLKHKWKVVQ